MEYKSNNPMFRSLSNKEEKQFRMWAHKEYVVGSEINPVWHPVVQEECRKINGLAQTLGE